MEFIITKHFTKRQILRSTGKGQALTVEAESVPELDKTHASLCNNEKRAQNSPKSVVWGMINVNILYCITDMMLS